MVDLRANELKILSTLAKFIGGKASVEKLTSKCKLSDAAVMRTALTLQEKELVKIYAKPETMLKLNAEGKLHAENGLPERRLLNALLSLGGKATLDKAAEKAHLNKQFAQIALSWTLRKKWAAYDSKTNTLQAASAPTTSLKDTLVRAILLCV